MAYRSVHIIVLSLVALACINPRCVSGQAEPETDSARSILQWSAADQAEFIKSTIDQGFPESRADQMTMLIPELCTKSPSRPIAWSA